MIFQKFGITSRQFKALIGGIILKFSTAVITCWGNINLYFLSQFHYQGTKITPQTNSLILLVSVPPMVLAMLFANKLCYKYGFQFVIRVCCLLFLIAPLASIFIFNVYSFSIFSILIPGSMYALLSIPVLNCIWTQFPQSKNKATSVLVVAFGLGSIVWNFLFMHMINPNNQDTIDQHHQINFFSQSVTKNVQKTAIIGFIITGILALIGSLLIERKNQEEEQLRQQKQIKQTQSIPQTKQKQLKQPSDQFFSQDTEKPTIPQKQLNIIKSGQNLTYKQALKDQRFLIIMTISILTGLYEIYLMMNFKIIYMPIISDDHFLGYASMICSVVAMGGAFLWGFLGDYKGIYLTILILSILDLCGKIFSDFAMNKPTIVIMVVLIGLISKSMTTIAGPGFVQIFGLKLGTQLLPLKGVAIILGYVLVPLFQIATAKYLDPHQYLICISFFSVITLICAIRLNIIRSKQLKYKQNEEVNQNKNNFNIQQDQKERQIQEIQKNPKMESAQLAKQVDNFQIDNH